MIRIVTDNGKHRLPFYLALEEWVARCMPDAEYLFAWRVEPTVIFGRNQNPALEVNLEYCREHDIQVYRRRSGGGCVYADMDNLMISYITPRTDVATTFSSYTSRIAEVLRGLGVPAEATGRNDVAISGRKVSGNAFYHLPRHSIVHGTMLFSTNMAHMLNAITPSRSKLHSKQVASVESRITTLSEHLKDLSIDDFEEHLYSQLTDTEYALTPEDIAAVEAIEAKYYELAWIFGKTGLLYSPKSDMRVRRRFPGVGELDMIVSTCHGIISGVDITGDFFLLSDLDSSLIDKLKGCELKRSVLEKALSDTDVQNVISGLQTGDFVDFLLSAKSPVHNTLIEK